jgi:hypothetical protein
MLKTIPKSNVSKRSFQVYKLWYSDTDINQFTSLTDGEPLYSSIKSKYYSNDGNVFNLFGSTKNIGNISREREITDTIYVLDIDRNKFGEQIKRKSVRLTGGNGLEYVDDSFGKIVSPTPTYRLVSIDFQTAIITLDEYGVQYEIDIISEFDLDNPYLILVLNGDVDNYYLVRVDFEAGTISFETELNFEGITLTPLHFGNVFYSDGLLVMTTNIGTDSYTLEYRSTQTIYETEILLTARAGEFNYSQNPSAVDVILSGSYEFETTEIVNGQPGGTKKIKEVLDIKRRDSYNGSFGTSTGSWDDYYNSSSIDPTGSYLAPYITTIGIYDDEGDMVAIAKLPNPIKNLPDYDINFIVRLDT